MAFDKDEVWKENVLELIPKPEVRFVKSPRYRSVHSKRAREELARAKSAHRTFGLACVGPSIRPSEFLKRGSGARAAVVVEHVHVRQPLPGLPNWRPTAGRVGPAERAKVDFTKKNVELAKALKAKRPALRHADTKNGHTYELLPSGLLPVYLHKQNFGQVPKRSKSAPTGGKRGAAAAAAAAAAGIERRRAVAEKSACSYITEDERADLLEATRNKWSELMKQFQCLPFLIDTAPKVKRKAALEAKLKQLEKDVQLIENHPYIYVYDQEDDQ